MRLWPIAAVACLILCSPSFGQVQIQAGASSFMGSGGGLTFYAPNSEMRVSGGVFSGRAYIGVSDMFLFRDWLVTAGDSLFNLNSGNLALSSPVRGVSARRKFKKSDLQVFSGVVGDVYSSPYFFGIGHASIGGGFAYTRELGHFRVGTIQASTRGRKTSLEETAYERGHFRLREQAGLLEGTKMLNGGATYSSVHFGADVGRATYILQSTPDSPAQRVNVNDASVSGMVSHFNASASVYNSNVNTGVALQAGARFGWLGVSASDYSSKTQRTALINITQTARHWNLSQVYTRDLKTGANNFNVGGGYTTNTISAQVGWTEMFFPLLNKPFQRVLTASISVHFHSLSINVGSVVNQNGKINWATYGNDYMQTHVPLPNVPGATAADVRGLRSSSHGGKHIMRIEVRDTDGNKPVEGAAIVVNKDTVFTDTQGRASSRQKHASTTLHVDSNSFMQGGEWVVVSAPDIVEEGKLAVVVVRRK